MAFIASVGQTAQCSTVMSGGKDEETQPILEENTAKKRKVTLAVIALSNLCAWSCISLIAPFFPIEAAKKGASETVIGIIFSCSELVIFLVSPIFGKLLTMYNPKFFYIGGLIVFACCDIMYGWLNLSSPGVPFITICFAVRIVAAVGTASMMTATFAIAGNNFPDRIGTVYGILETAVGCGFMTGPAIGGGLYQLGGFGLPFWVLGGIVIVCGIASLAVIPTQSTVKTVTVHSSLTLLRSAKVWIGSCCMVVALVAFSVWGPVFAQHLQQFQLSQSTIGLIFVTPAVAYSLTTPLWGLMLDKKIPSTSLMMIGLSCGAIVFLFYGPAPFFTFLTPMLWLTVVILILMGLTQAPVIVSCMRCIVEGARELGFKDDSTTFGLVGGIIQSANCLGTFTGPLLGGALTEKFGFGWTMTIISMLLILPVICVTPYLIIRARRNRWQSVEHTDSSYVVMKEDKLTDYSIIRHQ